MQHTICTWHAAHNIHVSCNGQQAKFSTDRLGMNRWRWEFPMAPTPSTSTRGFAGLTPHTSALGRRSPLPHPHRVWAHSFSSTLGRAHRCYNCYNVHKPRRANPIGPLATELRYRELVWRVSRSSLSRVAFAAPGSSTAGRRTEVRNLASAKRGRAKWDSG
jgi:hypothetical protein